jgi:hypothetical protein
MPVFVIDDEIHAEEHGEFDTWEGALTELRRRAAIPWDQEPNKAPCMSWATCGRDYGITEHDGASRSVRVSVLRIDESGVQWDPPFAADAGGDA